MEDFEEVYCKLRRTRLRLHSTVFAHRFIALTSSISMDSLLPFLVALYTIFGIHTSFC